MVEVASAVAVLLVLLAVALVGWARAEGKLAEMTDDRDALLDHIERHIVEAEARLETQQPRPTLSVIEGGGE